MDGPWRPQGIVLDVELNEPTEYLRITPNRLPDAAWLHDPNEFNRSLSRGEIVDQFSLADNEAYEVAVVEVPAGEQAQIGDVAGIGPCSGGGNLVRVLERGSIPEAWIRETTTLDAYLEGGGAARNGNEQSESDSRQRSGLVATIRGALGL